jgi:hypothetical protein
VFHENVEQLKNPLVMGIHITKMSPRVHEPNRPQIRNQLKYETAQEIKKKQIIPRITIEIPILK